MEFELVRKKPILESIKMPALLMNKSGTIIWKNQQIYELSMLE